MSTDNKDDFPETGEVEPSETFAKTKGAREDILETLEGREAELKAAREGMLEIIGYERVENVLLFHKRYCPEIRFEDIPGFSEALDQALLFHAEQGEMQIAVDKFLLFGKDVQVTKGSKLEKIVLEEIIECLEGNDLETAIELRKTLGKDIEFRPQQLKGLVTQTVEDCEEYDLDRVLSVFFGSDKKPTVNGEVVGLQAEKLEALKNGDLPLAIKLDTKLQS